MARCTAKSCDVATGKCTCASATSPRVLAPVPAPTPGRVLGPIRGLPPRPSLPGASAIGPPMRRSARAVPVSQRLLGDTRGGSRLVTFADNLVMVADVGPGTTETTEPIEMNGADRFSGIVSVHYMFGGSTRQLEITIQGSNDGVNWVDVATWDAIPGPPLTRRLRVEAVVFAFVRLGYELTGTPPPPPPSSILVAFDLHAVLDSA